MKFKSENMTQASGSIAGVTYAHNSSGLYRRARSIPTNPNSAAQLVVRARFGNNSVAWRESLTQLQRDAWNAYAANSPVTNVFGDSLVLSGQQMFVRCKSIRDQLGLTALLDAPSLDGLTTLHPPVVELVQGGGNISFGIHQGDDWVSTTGGGLVVQTSRFMGPAINFFRSPFRFAGPVLGDDDPVPGPTITFGARNAFGQALDDATVGQVLFFRFTAIDALGRPSPPVIQRVPVIAGQPQP